MSASTLLSNRIALITGAASGLGLATAERFLQLGGRVILVDLVDNVNTANVLKLYGDSCIFQHADVTAEDEINNALDAGERAFNSPVNVALNCAGIAPPVRVLGREGKIHALDVFSNTLNINTVGSFNVLRLCAARMATAEPYDKEYGERGVIINTSSIAAYDGQIGQCAYAASKGAIVSMTLPAARDLASSGIRVNAIAPGIIKTPMLEGLPQAARDKLSSMVTFPKRLGSPKEYASLVQHIVENKYINGEVIRCDGALRMP